MARSPRMRCDECDAFHGGVNGDYCPDCYRKIYGEEPEDDDEYNGSDDEEEDD